MANKYWVGGAGTLDLVDTTHWSDADGGAGGAVVPSTGDVANFTALSGGGTVTVNANFSYQGLVMGAFTGTLDFSANNNSPTLQTFSYSGTGTRTLNLGSGTFTITGNAATVWDGGTVTNLTLSAASSTVNFTYSGGTGTRTVAVGNNVTYRIGNVLVSAGTDIFDATSTFYCIDLNFTGFAGSWQQRSTNMTGSLTLGAAMTVTGATVSDISMGATSGIKTITSNGVQLKRSLTINGTGGTFRLTDALNLGGIGSGAVATFTLTNGTFDATNGGAGNFNVTCGVFASANSNTRTLTMGSGVYTITGSGTSVWNLSTGTNMTMTDTTCSVYFTYSGSVGTRTISNAIAGSVQPTISGPRFYFNAGSDILAFNANSAPVFQSIDFTGFSGSMTGPTTSMSIRDTFIISTGMTVDFSGASTGLVFIGTSTNSSLGTFTTNGKTINNAINFSGSGGSWILGSSLVSTGTITLTQGTLNAANFNVTCGIFSSSNANTRVLTMGSGTWTLTGNAATIWTTATTTGLTLTGSGTVVCTYSGATGTRTLSGGSVAINNLSITAGTDLVTLTNMLVANLDWTGFSGSWRRASSSNISISGNLTISATMLVDDSGDASNTITFTATSGTKTITTNGVTIMRNFTFNGVGGTWQLADNLVLNLTTPGAWTPTITLTNGTFDANNKNVTALVFNSSNSNTRTLTMGSGTWTLTGTGTVWNTATTTGLTLSQGTSTIVVNNASSSSKTIASGVTTLNNLTFTGAGTGTFIIGTTTGTSTFNNITVSTPPHTVQVFAGKTINVSSITWSGTLGSLNTFQSTTNGTAWNIVDTSGTNSQNYISLQDSHASGGASFYAGDDSIDVSGNTGWLFTFPPIASGLNASHDENGRPTIICASETDGTTIVPIMANPSNHAVLVDDNPGGSDNGNNGGNAMMDQNMVSVWTALDSNGNIVEVYGNSNGELLIDSQ